jgi:hypothetical protein
MPNPAQVRHKTGTTRLPAGNVDWVIGQSTPVSPAEVPVAAPARRVRGAVNHLVPTARHLLGWELPARFRRPSRLTRQR